MRSFRASVVLVLTILAITQPAGATNPNWPNANASRADLAEYANWPDDPSYGYLSAPYVCGSGTNMGQMVQSPQQGNFELWGFYPPDYTDPCGGAEAYDLSATVPASETSIMNGTGISADVAWTMTTGDPHVLIAIHDSGAEWGSTDVVNKWYLNKGELTIPETASGQPCVAPQGAESAYDCNGDGVFNVLDYTSGSGHAQPAWSTVVDPRLLASSCGDYNHNGILDPEDLIHCFSDGIDQDGDGFTDDISGWDFFKNTNDPIDDENYGHGNDEANWSSAEGNNGIGSLGVCPDCRVIMVRVGDSFIADSDHFAEGVYFSLSQGANVISEALGTINNTPFAQAAIDAAYAQGAIVIASAADEDSLHHNQPGEMEHTLLVHAITSTGDIETAQSFVQFNNCSNAGGHLVLSTTAPACSSEATGLSAGEAGLLYSAMLKFNSTEPPLTTPEAMQLMQNSAEDINVPGSTTNPNLYPSGPGWQTYFGYGRNDCGAAVTMIKNGQIPPVVDVTSPLWFQTIDPGVTLTIAGTVSASRATNYDFTVSVAPGLQPDPSAFLTVASKTGLTAATSGTLATADITNLIPDDSGVSTDPNAFAATILVQATAHYGGSIGDVQGVFRKAIFVHHDPDLLPGFPIFLGASGESSGHLVDLDGKGTDTLILATADGRVHAIEANGKERTGFPVQVHTLTDVASLPAVPAYQANSATDQQAIDATVAVGSLNNDGTLQIVASTLDGQVYAWNTDGSLVSGFPVMLSHFVAGSADMTDPDGTIETYVLGKGFFASPTLYDLGGDGKLEIIEPGEDGWLYVWDGQGQPYPGFPVEIIVPGGATNSNGQHQLIHARSMTTPAVGDITGDGTPKIIIGSNENYTTGTSLEYAIWNDGNNHANGPFLPSWPIHMTTADDFVLPDVGSGQPNPAALANLSPQTKSWLDIGVGVMGGFAEFFDGTGQQIGTGEIEALGALAQSNPGTLGYGCAINTGAFADVDGDGKLDFVDGTLGLSYAVNGINASQTRQTPTHSVSAWSAQLDYGAEGTGFTAEPLPGFPAPAADYQFFMNYAVADIDGDGKNEIISSSGVYLVTAYRADGSQPTGWPKNTGGWVITTPALGDINGDGYMDVVVLTREGWLWAWTGHGTAANKIEWEGYAHDPRNTGNYETPLEVRHGPPPASSGCGGSSSSHHCGTGGETLPALLIALGALRRRRRLTGST